MRVRVRTRRPRRYGAALDRAVDVAAAVALGALGAPLARVETETNYLRGTARACAEDPQTHKRVCASAIVTRDSIEAWLDEPQP